jgi:two-component system response regulator AtoC
MQLRASSAQMAQMARWARIRTRSSNAVARAQQVASLVSPGLRGPGPDVIFGQTEEMHRIRQTVERVASIRVPVLIQGESGSGKEVIANYLHQISAWAEKAFIKVNCAAIPGSLLESELFGFEKGAFTGAYTSRPGKFELANGGTMLLDEIADVDSGLQAKLLQVLQDGCFSRLGDLEERQADVRIICISNRDVQSEIERGSFREDLFYRINVVNIQAVPLRKRTEDIPVLVDYFLRHYAERYERRVQPISSSVMERFRQHAWPGNIRELENYLKRYVILDSPESILSELEDRTRAGTNGNGFQLPPVTDFNLKKYSKAASQQAEHHLILEALKSTRWNRKRAAELLGISYRALLYKIKEAGLPQKKSHVNRA